MLSGHETRISSQYNQVKAGGDLAALTGICKALVAFDAEATAAGEPSLLDRDFIRDHTHGFDAFYAYLARWEWDELERRSGLDRAQMEATARIYGRAKAAIGIYGMGLTQHRAGVETVQMLVNLLLLRGNIGRPGAGISPVRGHSNVQGQRTVGIAEKPELIPMDKLRDQFGFEPPREKGLNTVEACEKILAGEVDAFVMLGGNFVRAIPDRGQMEPAWRRMRLTVNVATKLNRSHLVPGQVSYILPVSGRIEVDRTALGPQATSMEDSSGCVHGSKGVRAPASPHLISEVRFITELARVALDPNPKVPWDTWQEDYAAIRAAIAETYPEIFHDYEERMWKPGGFHRPIPARERVWKTENGRANFITPEALDEDKDMPEVGHDVFRLITLRSNDQFNTTVYGYSDRFRGIEGTRDVVLMNRADMARLDLRAGDTVTLRTSTDRDAVDRALPGLAVLAYDIPAGCLGAYYPEANVLLPVWHYAEGSKTPAAKCIPVTVHKEAGVAAEPGLAAAE